MPQSRHNDAAHFGAWTHDEVADYLLVGYWADEGRSPHLFSVDPGQSIRVNLTDLDEAGRSFARFALESWSYASGLGFVEVGGGEVDISFGDAEPGAFSASRYYSSGKIINSSVNVSADWVSRDLDRSGAAILNSYSTQVYIHEIGHALGLGHAGHYNGAAEYSADGSGDNLYLNDTWQTSVMSYFSQDSNSYLEATKAYLGTPMLADIIAVQRAYGALGVRMGNDTYVSDARGSYFDRALAAGMAVAIHDEGGIDTIDFSSSRLSVRVDMNEGSYSDVGDKIGILGISHGTVIENVRGGLADDSVIGNGAANEIFGGSGKDLLRAGGGADRVHGGDGHDKIEGGSGQDFLTGGAGQDEILGGSGDDEIYAGQGDNDGDDFDGGSGNDILAGGAGDDVLEGGSGFDSMFGGEGKDQLRDSGKDGRGSFAFGGSGEDVVSGNDGGNDILGGGRHDDVVYGLAGDDTIYGGSGVLGGNDTLHGGSGSDVIFGGSGSDKILGGGGDDSLFNGGGSDTVNGEGGNDLIYGGAGNDHLTGGAGADTFLFVDGGGLDVISDFSPGVDLIKLSSSAFGVNSFREVQGVSAESGDDLLILIKGEMRIKLQATAWADLTAENFFFMA